MEISNPKKGLIRLKKKEKVDMTAMHRVMKEMEKQSMGMTCSYRGVSIQEVKIGNQERRP